MVVSFNIVVSNIEVWVDFFDLDGEGINDFEDLGNEMISMLFFSINLLLIF